MKLKKWTAKIVFLCCCAMLISCSKASAPSSASGGNSTASQPNDAIQPQSPAAVVDPCSKFSPADAQAIMGMPMKLLPGHGAIVCMYEEASPKNAGDFGRVSLTLSVVKSSADEDQHWNNLKVIRHLKAGEKNISQLTGIGDEAWLDGYIEKGKVGVGGILARKGSSHLMLESASLTSIASVDQLKTIAKRIANELK